MKNCPTPDELANLMETVELGVGKTKFGPLFQYDPGDLKVKKVNQLNLSLFSTILVALLSKVEFEGAKKGE